MLPGDAGHLRVLTIPFHSQQCVAGQDQQELFVLLAEHFDEVARENPDFSAYMKSLASGRKFELDHKD